MIDHSGSDATEKLKILKICFVVLGLSAWAAYVVYYLPPILESRAVLADHGKAIATIIDGSVEQRSYLIKGKKVTSKSYIRMYTFIDETGKTHEAAWVGGIGSYDVKIREFISNDTSPIIYWRKDPQVSGPKEYFLNKAGGNKLMLAVFEYIMVAFGILILLLKIYEPIKRNLSGGSNFN